MADPTTIKLYENVLGRLLRDLGAPAELSAPYDSLPLVYQVTVADEAASFLNQRQILLGQRMRQTVSELVREQVKAKVLPTLGRDQGAPDFSRHLIEAHLQNGLKEIAERISALVAQEMDSDRDWQAYRRRTRNEVLKVTVLVGVATLGLATAAPSGGIGLVAAGLGFARAVLDGAQQAANCWRNVEEANARLARRIDKLARAYQKSIAGGRAMGVAGAASTASGLGQLVKLGDLLPDRAQRVVGKLDLPSLGELKEDMEAYRGKLGHLGAYAEKLSERVGNLLDRMELIRDAGDPSAAKLEEIEVKVRRLLDDGVTLKRGGFRGRFTVSALSERYERGMRSLEAADTALRALQALEPQAGRVEVAEKIAAGLVNMGLAVLNYGQAIQLGVPAPAAEVGQALGFLSSPPVNVAAAATAMAADAYGTVKDINDTIDAVGELRPPEAEGERAELVKEFTRLAFAPGHNGAPRLPDIDGSPLGIPT